MRDDIKVLLKADGIHLVGAAKRQVEHASGDLPKSVEIKLFLVGQLAVFHWHFPAPERLRGTVAIAVDGVFVHGEVWRNTYDHHLAWRDIRSMKATKANLGSLSIDIVCNDERLIFMEPFRGKVSDEHARDISKICSSYLPAPSNIDTY